MIGLVSCNYEPTDPKIIIDGGIYYKMIQYDFDGMFEEFPIIFVEKTIEIKYSNARVLSPDPKDCADYPNACVTLCDNGDLVYCEALCNLDPITYSDACVVLPIELLYFKGNMNDDGVYLEFATASELNADYVQILGSLDGTSWYDVVRLPSECPDGCEYQYQDDLSWVQQIFK